MKKQRIWPVLLAAGIGFCILCGLGVWQVKRLAWKEALIADLDTLGTRPPAEIDARIALPALDGSGAPYAEYTPIKATGQFVGENPFRLIATANGQGGWRQVQVFKVGGDMLLLVDRGVLPEGKSAPPPNGEMTIQGVVRFHAKGAGLFDPNNSPTANQWFWWDTEEMWNKALNNQPGSIALNNFVLQLLPGSPGTEGLIVVPPKAELHNNHLGYAITWFGLAAALVGVTGAFIWRSTRP
jgi:surfeit locus 1 family protein